MNIPMVQSNFFEMLTFKSVYRYLIPGAVVTLIYGSFMWSMGWIGEAPDVNTSELGWSAKLIYWLTSGAKWFSTMMFEFVVITLFSPVMALLSEHIENILNEKEYPFTIQRMITELLRTVGILVTGFIFSFIVIMLWNLIAWIGDLKAITPYIVFIFKAFFIGFNFFDYTLERNQVSIGKSWRYAINHPIFMLFVGAVFSIIFAIPILGVMTAPFIATILATMLWFHQKRPKRQIYRPDQ